MATVIHKVQFIDTSRWILVVLGSILFLSMYLPHTWRGEANLEEYNKTLKDLDKNIQEVKQKYQVSGIVVGMDAQFEVKPRHGPFVGDGTRMSHGNTMRYCEMESKYGTWLMEWGLRSWS